MSDPISRTVFAPPGRSLPNTAIVPTRTPCSTTNQELLDENKKKPTANFPRWRRGTWRSIILKRDAGQQGAVGEQRRRAEEEAECWNGKDWFTVDSLGDAVFASRLAIRMKVQCERFSPHHRAFDGLSFAALTPSTSRAGSISSIRFSIDWATVGHEPLTSRCHLSWPVAPAPTTRCVEARSSEPAKASAGDDAAPAPSACRHLPFKIDLAEAQARRRWWKVCACFGRKLRPPDGNDYRHAHYDMS
ncbi:hypothetical protein VTJ83DRAFT_4089 [Remersonia thermophila]|uniref:Uncharacterized protein n=1 Tax=Remersonia thermophila TaxID=72144 RepID=A0ABR4DFV1_9PEZI